MAYYEPASLGPVSFVEVVSLIPEFDRHNGPIRVRFKDPDNPVLDALERANPSFIANNGDAQIIAQLFRELSYGEPDRCHIPPYGFKFHLTNTNTVFVSLCWECNNAAVWLSNVDNISNGFNFNAQSESAQELLKFCRKFLPPISSI